MDVALVSGPEGGVGLCGEPVSQNRASNAKKNELKPWLQECWVIPPQANSEFVCCMEDVLSLYTRPDDPAHPLVCLDETSQQLVSEKQLPLPAEPGQLQRYDYEYERQGVCNLFMMSEPLAGCRHLEAGSCGLGNPSK